MPYTRRTPRRPLRHLITLPELDDANEKVTGELFRLGFWAGQVPDIGVYLVSFSAYGLTSYGWYQGSIYIPRVSGAQLFDLLSGHHTRLTDILRHEWAHGVADAFPGLIDSRRFREVFGGSYEESDRIHEYDPMLHVTRYASAMPCEDFSEIFHHYLRHKGRIPAHLTKKPVIVRKWNFIQRMAERTAKNRHRW